MSLPSWQRAFPRWRTGRSISPGSGRRWRARQRREKKFGQRLFVHHASSSKGLEYRIVFIIDANEGVTPHRRTVFEEDMEEGARLFYVAMTRAKELLLHLSVKKLYGKKAERSRLWRSSWRNKSLRGLLSVCLTNRLVSFVVR